MQVHLLRIRSLSVCVRDKEGEWMEISQFMDSEVLVGFFIDIMQLGFLPGFMIVTLLHLLGYGIFKTLSFLNIRR